MTPRVRTALSFVVVLGLAQAPGRVAAEGPPPTLTATDQLREATHVVQRIQGMSLRISVLLDRARSERDPLRQRCLDDKLSQVNALLRLARDQQLRLEGAVAAGDEGTRRRSFGALAVVRSRAEALGLEALHCTNPVG